MGRKNIDRMCLRDFIRCDTAGKMAASGWRVWSRCEGCGDQRDVPLGPILQHPRLGPDFPMWDRRPLCRRRCGAKVHLFAQMPGSPKIEPLLTTDPGLPMFTRKSVGSWQYGTVSIGDKVVSEPFQEVKKRW